MMKPLRTLCLAFSFCFFSALCIAQLPNGSVAPDFTVVDLNGNQHNLQTYLDQGKTVVLDWSATWCAPCWSYHQSHALADLYNQYGPSGTDEFMVFMMEGDMDTEEACLYGPTGCTGGTQGDWTAGTPYPIVEVTDPSLVSAYSISYWPTIYTICPDGYIYESGQSPTSTHATWSQSCTFATSLASATGMDCYADQSGTIDQDVAGGYGNISFSWSHGGNTEDLQNLYPGTYSCTATEGNGIERVLEDIVVEGPASELIAQVQNYADISCHGAGDGTINISTNGGTPGYSYAWSNGATTEDISNLPGGSYTLVVTDDNACTKELTVDIIDPDAVTADVETTVENCGRNDATIDVVGAGGTGSLTYTYGTLTNTTGRFINVSSGVGEVIVKDANNCIYTEQVVIEEIPAPDAEIFPADPLDCQTTSITLGASASVGSEFSYIWTTTDGHIVSGANTLTPVVDAPGLYEFLVVNNTNGCFTQAQITVEGSGDLPEILFAQPELFTCSTTEVVVDASNSSNGSDYVFEWTTDDGEIISGAASDILTVGTPGTYTLVLTNTLTDCSSTQSIIVEGDSDLPVAAVEGPTAIDCENLMITLDGSSSSQGEDFDYEWSTEDGQIESTSGDQAVVSAAGEYILTVINTVTGCITELVITIDDESEYVDALWVFESNQLAIELENMTTGNPNSIQWDMGNGDIIQGDITDYVYSEPGTYQVCMTAENGCGSDTYCQEIVVTKKVREREYEGWVIFKGSDGENGSQSLDGGSKGSTLHAANVSVYPNPTTGDFTIHLDQNRLIKNYSVVHVNGQVIMNRDMNLERSQIAVNGSNLQDGTYFIQIQLDNEMIVKPLIIIR